MPKTDPAATTAYDALVQEYEDVSRKVAASRRPRTVLERARTQLSYARRAFRIAGLQAPAEGATHANFDRSLTTIRTCLANALAELNKEH